MEDSILVLREKINSLMNRVYPALTNFPRHEKTTLSAMMRESLLKSSVCLSMALRVKSKSLGYVTETQGHLEAFHQLLRFSRDRRYVSLGFFSSIDLLMIEIQTDISSIFKLLSGRVLK